LNETATQSTKVSQPEGQTDYQPYDGRNLSYAKTFTDPTAIGIIRTIEWMTGKLRLLHLIRKFEAGGVPRGQAFWRPALDMMGIPLETPVEQIARIPTSGPVIIVANHPHGLVDGMVLADLIGRVRTDYKILTRSLLTDVDEINQFMIPVPFPHEEDALRKNLQMRKDAMTHLSDGGVVVLFPSGVVASSPTWFGAAVEDEWNPFTAKMIQRSGAAVLPIRFTGQNSRLYQIANLVSPILRQGLLLHEVVHSLNKPMAPIVGHVLAESDVAAWSENPRGFMAWLRDHTLSLVD
jgi:putative hemolysin